MIVDGSGKYDDFKPVFVVLGIFAVVITIGISSCVMNDGKSPEPEPTKSKTLDDDPDALLQSEIDETVIQKQ